MSSVCCDGGLGAAPSRSGGWADAVDALRHAYGLRGGTQAHRRDQQDRPTDRAAGLGAQLGLRPRR